MKNAFRIAEGVIRRQLPRTAVASPPRLRLSKKTIQIPAAGQQGPRSGLDWTIGVWVDSSYRATHLERPSPQARAADLRPGRVPGELPGPRRPAGRRARRRHGHLSRTDPVPGRASHVRRLDHRRPGHRRAREALARPRRLWAERPSPGRGLSSGARTAITCTASLVRNHCPAVSDVRAAGAPSPKPPSCFRFRRWR